VALAPVGHEAPHDHAAAPTLAPHTDVHVARTRVTDAHVARARVTAVHVAPARVTAVHVAPARVTAAGWPQRRGVSSSRDASARKASTWRSGS
jgi:hypothetical protein